MIEKYKIPVNNSQEKWNGSKGAN